MAFWNFASEHSCIFRDVKSSPVCNVDFYNVLKYLFYINSVLRISDTLDPNTQPLSFNCLDFSTGERDTFSIKEFNNKSTVIKIPFQITGKQKTDGL